MKKLLSSKQILPCGLFLAAIVAGFVLDMKYPFVYEAMEDVFGLLFSVISVVIGVWITCYFLIIELFKDRYPFNFVDEEQMSSMKRAFFMLAIDVVFGVLVALVGNYFWAAGIFSVASIGIIVSVFIDVYRSSKTLMINTYIEKFFTNMKNDFNAGKMGRFEELRKDIWRIFDECVVKEEFFVARSIAKKTGDIFRVFLTNSIQISQNSEKEDTEDEFDKIVRFNINQLDLCKAVKSELMVETIIFEQRENLEFCAKHDRFEWFKKYMHKFNQFVFQMQKEEYYNITEKLYAIVYVPILEMMIDQGKQDWIEYTINDIESMTITYVYAYNKVNIRNYAMLLSSIAQFCVKKEKDQLYAMIEKKFNRFVGLKCSENGVFNEVQVSYALLFYNLVSNDEEKAFSFLIKVMRHPVKCAEDAALIDFKCACIKELLDKEEKGTEKAQRLFEFHVQAIIEAIGLKKDYDGRIELPDFYSRIIDSEYAKEKYKEVIKQIPKMLNHCIIKDNLPAFYAILEEVKETLEKTEQRQRDIQKSLIQIYFWAFSRTAGLVNQQFFEVAASKFSEAVLELDKNREISADLGKYIVEELYRCDAQGDTIADSKKLILTKVNLLSAFVMEGTEYTFFVSHSDRKRLVGRTLFNIGMTCIENGFEEGVRRVSNAIGWFIIYSIQQGTNELSVYLISRANELFYTAKRMEVTYKTQMFMLTLFTTVGSYCCMEPKNNRFLKGILKGIADEELERINIAVSLRTSENDMWNDLYNNKTEQLTKDFLNRFRKMKENKEKA